MSNINQLHFHPELVASVQEETLQDYHAAVPSSALQEVHPPFARVESDEERHQELLSTVDHLMLLIGNPIRTLLAVSEHCSSLSDLSIDACTVLHPNDVIISHNNIVEVRDRLRSMEIALLQFRDQSLPAYNTCVICFHRAEEAFANALQLFRNKNTPWSAYQEGIQLASAAFTAFATSVHHLRTAQAAAIALISPGAYHISAEDAAREGSFFHASSQPPREAVEATLVELPMGHLQPFPKKDAELRLLRKAPYRPDGLSVVQAEAPIMMVHGIPVAEATIVPQEISTNHPTPQNSPG